MGFVYEFIADEQGQNTIEYVIIIAVIAVGLIAILASFRGAIQSKFTELASSIRGAR